MRIEEEVKLREVEVLLEEREELDKRIEEDEEELPPLRLPLRRLRHLKRNYRSRKEAPNLHHLD